MFDLLIRGGRVVDGTGLPPRTTDVGIERGVIAEVGPLDNATGRKVIEATGLVVAPGFVDIHSHGDVTLITDPRARSALAQGVTTILIGNCGQSPAPLPMPGALPHLTFGLQEPFTPDWTTFAGFLSALERARPAVNVASLVGHSALRVAALGQSPREATPKEQQVMVRELVRAMDEGAFGLSSGLEYPLGAAATTDELVLLATEVAKRSGLYAIHTRDRDFRAVEAFDETFQIAERSRAALQISHIAPRYGAPSGSLVDVLERVDRARSNGLDVACDQHTRFHGITKLTTMLPPSASAAGTAGLLEQLRDPKARESFHGFRGPVHKMGLMGEWDRLWLFEAPRSPAWVGKAFDVIARERGQHPLDAIMDILLEAGDDAQNVLFIGLVQDQQDLDLTFGSPHCCPESDATTLSLDGPLAGQRFLGAYTWATYYLRSVWRERHILALEEAVRRLTRMPAERIGLSDRGLLSSGYQADVTVFDAGLVSERGTVTDPNRYATGIRHVIVNGQLAYSDEQFAPRGFGQVIRRAH